MGRLRWWGRISNRLKRLLGTKRWRWIFSEVACRKSRLDASRAVSLARRRLGQIRDAIARQFEYRANVQLAQVSRLSGSCRRGHGSAICYSGDGSGTRALLRISVPTKMTLESVHVLFPSLANVIIEQGKGGELGSPKLRKHLPKTLAR